MSTERARDLLNYLASVDGWVTADELAGRLGVTTRSVRNYVVTAKELHHPHDVIETGSRGYRLQHDVFHAVIAASDAERFQSPAAERPVDRQRRILEYLVSLDDPVNLHSLAAEFYVSESTLESDLRRARTVLGHSGLALGRIGSELRVLGSEQDKRRMLARLFLDAQSRQVIDLPIVEAHFASPPLGQVKTLILDGLERSGYRANEFGLGSVLLSLAVALLRMSNGQTLLPATEGSPTDPALEALAADLLGPLVAAPPPPEVRHLALLLDAQVARPTDGSPAKADEPVVDAAVTVMLDRATEVYGVDLRDVAFHRRLAQHVVNVLGRAKENLSSPNPMTKSLKANYPVVYDIAVFMASTIGTRFDVQLDENEIAFLALHVGTFVEQRSPRSRRLRCAFVCPDYYGMHAFLRDRIEQELHDVIDVTSVVTRTDPDWASIDANIVLSTIPAPAGVSDVIHIQPFLTDDDAARIRNRVARIHRSQRRNELKQQLLTYLSPEFFVVDLAATDDTTAIRALGELMVSADVIDESYVQAALEREQMSSTAFGDVIAVPHAMDMTARRTAIAFAVNKSPIPWGDNRVQAVALVAFAADDRAAFQSVFDQLVSVFSSREDANRIIRATEDFDTFLDALTRVMEN
ncbi:PTS sugar transporter subunit IIA [Lysinibacter cavernae]|uniref:Lichenan operon transcriptional antiterminator n=1 Tax=Lysinibacter cavernae TaxID=1640652 RepID=A0A7X5R2A7_9MICO|nr:lichenan operon transcriptional antiterminator [Lysinibacter cavernae]